MATGLKGKVAVITGAASGIGLATANALMDAGATVVMVDRNEAALNDLVAGSGGRAIAQVTDLVDPASCAAMVPEILAKTGRIDILHANAGIYIGGDLMDTDAETIDRMLNLNINAVIKNVHAVLPHMVGRGSGDIVVTCSLAGRSAISARAGLFGLEMGDHLLYPDHAAPGQHQGRAGCAGLAGSGGIGAAGRLARRPPAGGQGRRRHHRAVRRGRCGHVYPDPPAQRHDP